MASIVSIDDDYGMEILADKECSPGHMRVTRDRHLSLSSLPPSGVDELKGVPGLVTWLSLSALLYGQQEGNLRLGTYASRTVISPCLSDGARLHIYTKPTASGPLL